MNIQEIIKNITDLTEKLKALALMARKGSVPDNPKLFLKVIVPMLVSIENSLPNLRDLIDTLDYHEDPQSLELKNLVDALEENLNEVLPYIEELKKRHQNESQASQIIEDQHLQ